MDSAVLTRSSKGNKSIFQQVKQTGTTTEYTLGVYGYNKTHSLHTLAEEKNNSFLALISPLYPNSIQSHKSGCGFPMEGQAENARMISMEMLFCKGKQNIKWKDAHPEKPLLSSEICYVF